MSKPFDGTTQFHPDPTDAARTVEAAAHLDASPRRQHLEHVPPTARPSTRARRHSAWNSSVQAALVLTSLHPALAWAGDLSCRNGMFSAQDTSYALAKVTGAPRTYLRTDIAPCPDDGAACRGRVYVVPGDVVLTSITHGPFVCAYYPGKGGSAGFVRLDEVQVQPTPIPALSAWVGTWKDGDDSIVLHARGNQLIASGNAYWPSATPSLKDAPGGPHIGEMSGQAIPKDGTVVFAGNDPDDCRVKLTLLPPYLLAADNLNCGGANVSFIGVYRKK